MRILVFIETLGMGGTEKAACRWAVGLQRRNHSVLVVSLADGPRRQELTAAGIECRVAAGGKSQIKDLLQAFRPDVIHAHMPGFPSPIDIVFEALTELKLKPPVLQTNIFGQLANPRENPFVKFRLFVSWSSCVQAAQRAFVPLDRNFFRQASVAVNPLDADDGPAAAETQKFRESLGVKPDEVLLGQLCRPDPIRWDDFPLQAFRQAQRRLGNLKLLIREPPPEIAQRIQESPDAGRFILLPFTSDPVELRQTTASLDMVLHYSKLGESFGYGIAEPMNLGRPAIVNHAPWNNQGPLELVRPGECGFAVTTMPHMAEAILKLGADENIRRQMGEAARRHIRQLAAPEVSLNRVENALDSIVNERDNRLAEEDVHQAAAAERHLARHRFGHTFREQLALRPFYYRVRFHYFRKVVRLKFARPPAIIT
jgi:glycosyltransferase involved in cell wall biosynthesis